MGWLFAHLHLPWQAVLLGAILRRVESLLPCGIQWQQWQTHRVSDTLQQQAQSPRLTSVLESARVS